MSTPFIIQRVSTLPSDKQVNTLYIERVAGTTEAQLTFVGDTPDSIATTYGKYAAGIDIAEAVGKATAVFVFSDVESMRGSQGPSKDAIAFVKDASGDEVVTGVSAVYFYEAASATWLLAMNGDGSETSTNWDDIVGRPLASATAIDSAVTESHTHENKQVLDLIGVNTENTLTYNGKEVSSVTFTSDW